MKIILFCCFCVVMPTCITSCGTWLTGYDPRLCQFTAARPGLVTNLKKTFIVIEPSLLDVEVMYVMFSTPLIASSKGVATALATTSAFAPGYDAVTCTVGGAMSGNKVTGIVNNDINPNKRIMIDTTVDKTGLSINLFIMRWIYVLL